MKRPRRKREVSVRETRRRDDGAFFSVLAEDLRAMVTAVEGRGVTPLLAAQLRTALLLAEANAEPVTIDVAVSPTWLLGAGA